MPHARRRERTRLLASTVLLAPLLLPASPAATAQADESADTAPASRSYDIPAGPLATVLSRFASEAGVLLSADAELTAGIDSAGLQGEYTVRAGLRELLGGTGLQARFADAETVTLVRADADDELDAIRVEAETESAAGPVVGYKARRSATATRTDAAIQDTPASVQVVPREVIEDQQAFELREVLQNISGVTAAEGSTLIEARESVFTRGFRSRAIYYDGFRVDSLPTLDLANIERVEVLKGPASIVAGQIEPGGLVNLVPKRPGRESATRLGLEIGEFSFRRGTLDLTRTARDGSIGGRVVGSVTDAGSFRDFVDIERETLTPSLRADVGERGSFEVELLHYTEERPFDEGVAFNADGGEADDISTFLGGPDLDGSDFDWNGIRMGGELDLTQAVTLRTGVFHQDFEHDFEAFRPLSDPGEEPLGQAQLGALLGLTPMQTAALVPADPVADDEIFRFYDNTVIDVETTEFRLDTLSDFSTRGWQHQLLVGINVRRLERDIAETRGFDLVDDPAAVATGQAEFLPQKINIVDPQHGDAIPTQNVADGELDGEQDEIGLYVQDSVVGGSNDQWNLLAGLRYDEVEQEVFSDRAQDRLEGTPVAEDTEKTDDEVTARLGLLYRVAPTVAPFFSFSQSFSPSGTKVSGSTGELLDATTGEQFEAGVKFSLLRGNLTGTASVFRIEREDVPIQDPNDFTRFVNGGEQQSEGFELDVAGTPTDGLDILASLGFTDAEWEDSTQVEPGTPLRGVPDYTASLTGRWRIPDGPLEGVRLTGTVFTSDDRPGDDRDSFELDGFTTLSLGLARDWHIGEQTLSTRITLKNVTDEEFFVSSNSKSSVVPGNPRTLRAALTWRF